MTELFTVLRGSGLNPASQYSLSEGLWAQGGCEKVALTWVDQLTIKKNEVWWWWVLSSKNQSMVATMRSWLLSMMGMAPASTKTHDIFHQAQSEKNISESVRFVQRCGYKMNWDIPTLFGDATGYDGNLLGICRGNRMMKFWWGMCHEECDISGFVGTWTYSSFSGNV